MRQFSLVMATVGRDQEVRRFLRSLARQSRTDIDLVVVDQNDDDRVLQIVRAETSGARVFHLRSERGLSRARNIGLKAAEGKIVAFPDDDCEYPPGLLSSVAQIFQERPDVDGLFVPVKTPAGDAAVKADAREGLVTRWNAWNRAVSIGMFFRQEVVRRVGAFDESLGVGANTPWGACEDLDYPIRAIDAGFRILFYPSLAVMHPRTPGNGLPGHPARAYSYGAGLGRVLRKHRYPWWLMGYFLARALGGALRSMAVCDMLGVRYYAASLAGRWRGMRASNAG